MCCKSKTTGVFGCNNIGFIMTGKIRRAAKPNKGLQCGDISQKVGIGE
jgi:hypothetical protein